MSQFTGRMGYLLVGIILAGFVTTGCGSSKQVAKSESDRDDTVNVGYGKARRVNLTTSVSTVRPNSKRVYTSMAELIEGRVAGVQVQRLSDGGIALSIRGKHTFSGDNQPLVVIDGVPLSNPGSLAWVNPQDVDSIEFLKDSGAAIFGSRGANGVLLITTKRANN